MDKLAQPISPRTQEFMQGAPTGDEEKKLFEDGLTQMAYNVLTSRFPDLMPQVITFRILDTDIEKGAGIGAFVIQHGSDVLYVPVIMADNQIKPLDMFYHKNLNVFLPLNQDWLKEVEQLTLDEMGTDVETPKSLQRNVDTKHVMTPPTTGRYAYAAARTTNIKDDLLQMLTHLQTKTANAPQLLSFLNRAPDQVKTAFADILLKSPKLAASVSTLYGLDDLCTSLQKTANASSDVGGALHVADKDTPADKMDEIFGDKAPEAFQGVLREGYAAKDTRATKNVAVQIQTPQNLEAPSTAGFYSVFTRTGQMKPAFVLCNPIELHNHGLINTHRGDRHQQVEQLIVLNSGQYVRAYSKPVVAERIEGKDAKKSDVFGKLLQGSAGDTPKVGDHGIFVRKTGQGFTGTRPFTIKSISTDSLGVKRLTCDDYSQHVLIQDPNGAFKKFHKPTDTKMMYVPQDARFLRLHDHRRDHKECAETLIKDPKAVAELFQSELIHRAKPVTVKNASGGEFVINGREHHRGIAKTAEALALSHDIPFDDAAALVKQAARPRAHTSAYVLRHSAFQKLANPMTTIRSGAGDHEVASQVPQDDSEMEELRRLEFLTALEAQKNDPHAHLYDGTPEGLQRYTAARHALYEKFMRGEHEKPEWKTGALKTAQGPMMDPSSAMNGAPPPGAMPPGMDPSMMDPSMMDPSMMGGPPPPPPSPLDMAVGEANTQIQQQMADLEQQNMALQDKAMTLQNVQMRAQEIATGGGEATAMGAPPMPPPGMGAPQGAPPPGGAMPPGMPPGGAMPPGPGMAAPAPMPGAGGGGMAGGEMPPEMMGGTASMPEETPSAAEIQNQVNPQFLEQAAALQDTGAFDAAAISSMSQAPAFKAMVLDYVPVLERSLDNLGRILLSMWLQEGDLKQALGDDEYTDLEDNTRNVFDGLGKLILQLNQNTIVLSND